MLPKSRAWKTLAQLRKCRHLLWKDFWAFHCTRQKHNKLLYGETGRYPLFTRTAVKCVKYWLKLTKLPLSRLSRQTYEMLLAKHNQGKVHCVSKIPRILTENGFGIVWLCKGLGYEMQFVAKFKERLISCYKQNWHSEIESNGKYKWFHSFKKSFVAGGRERERERGRERERESEREKEQAQCRHLSQNLLLLCFLFPNIQVYRKNVSLLSISECQFCLWHDMSLSLNSATNRIS